MKHVPILLCLFVLAPSVHAWDPVGVLNNAVQGQVNRQINQSVADIFRSISQPTVDRRTDSVDIPGAGSGVVLYGTPGCGYCVRARQHMQSRGIRYLDKNVNSDRAALSEFKALGGRGVPLILLGQQKLSGFDATSFDAAYVRFQAEQASAANAGAGQSSAANAGAGQSSAAQAGAGQSSAAQAAQASVIPATSAGFAAGDVLVARIARVKLLSEPQPQAKVLGQLGKHEEVITLGEAQGRYIKIKSADLEGWADQALLAKP